MRILLVEDDEELNRLLSYQLTHSGFEVDSCFDGEDALYYIGQNVHDLILLDRLLPHLDGISILKKMRAHKNETPVILLTALGDLEDKVLGLDAGADDYLVKPFAFEELLARIRCISRRPRTLSAESCLSLGDISYQPETNQLSGPLGKCTLSKKEGALMEFFLRNKDQTLPRMTILLKVWGPDAEVEEGNLDNYVHFIRRRLKSVSDVVSIQTVRGVGYLLTGLS